MDYLHRDKRKRHLIRLFIGYAVIGSAVMVAVVTLFYLLSGYSYKNGTVIQNGMLFLSSSPAGASLVLNSQYNGTTNKRIITEAGDYNIQITKTGYRPWQRDIKLKGGWVQRYNYPLLIPKNLISSPVATFDGVPTLVSESPDNHWLLVGEPSGIANFRLIDLSNPLKLVPTNFSLPASLFSFSGGSWQLISWANDNQNVLLNHISADNPSRHEYILLNISNPSQSTNLESHFGRQLSSVNLVAQAYDQYWIYDAASEELAQGNLSATTVTPYLPKVLAYKDYAGGILVYLAKTDNGKANLIWRQGGQDNVIAYGLPLAPNASDYLLNLAQFNGDWYLAYGESGTSYITIYKNPLNFVSSRENQSVPAFWIMKIKNPNYLMFSTNAQFLLAENGTSVSVFNALYKEAYSYKLSALDNPEVHAYWMDGYHLLHFANGLLNVGDFNGINEQALIAASPGFVPVFSSNYEYLFTVSASGSASSTLERTPLRLPADI